MDNFNQLIKKVEAVDKKAAKTLKGFLKRSQAYKDKIMLTNSDDLESAFVWDETKQKHDYWAAIAYELY